MTAQAGATVIGVSRRQANLDQHLGPLIAEGLSVIPVTADLETAEGVAKVMACVNNTPGNLHGLRQRYRRRRATDMGPGTKTSRENWHTLFSQKCRCYIFSSARPLRRN